MTPTTNRKEVSKLKNIQIQRIKYINIYFGLRKFQALI